MVFGPACYGYNNIICPVTGFQFPLGIRWCSDRRKKEMKIKEEKSFNSPWELDGVRTV